MNPDKSMPSTLLHPTPLFTSERLTRIALQQWQLINCTRPRRNRLPSHFCAASSWLTPPYYLHSHPPSPTPKARHNTLPNRLPKAISLFRVWNIFLYVWICRNVIYWGYEVDNYTKLLLCLFVLQYNNTNEGKYTCGYGADKRLLANHPCSNVVIVR